MSPEELRSLDPSSYMTREVDLPHSPVVSKANDSKRYASGSCAYFLLFRSSASDAALPACIADLMMLEGAKVSVTVASHTRHFPRLYGRRVIPSGRLPSPLFSPVGSRVDGTPHDERALLTMSLSALGNGLR